MDLTPGTAHPAADGTLGIVARVVVPRGQPEPRAVVIGGNVVIAIKAAENVRKNWHAVALPDASVGGRRPGARGRRGVRTIPGARWLDNVKRGDIGRVRMSGSGPRGGRPR